MLVNSIAHTICQWLSKPAKNSFSRIINAVKRAWNDLFTTNSSNSTPLKNKTVILIQTSESGRLNTNLFKQALDEVQAIQNALSFFYQNNVQTDFKSLREQFADVERKRKADPQGVYGVFLERIPVYLSNKLRKQLIEILNEQKNIFSDLIESPSVKDALKRCAQRFKDELETLRVKLEHSKDTLITEDQFKAFCASTHNQKSIIKGLEFELKAEASYQVALPIIPVVSINSIE